MIAEARWHALADSFGLGPVRGRPAYVARGAMGEIWQLKTTTGRWAVKWQFEWSPHDARPFDVQVQLTAAAAGIPLPLPALTPDGAAVVQVGGRHARVYQWVDLGRPLCPPVGAAAAAEAGRLLGLLHSLAITCDEPADPWYTEVPPAGYWAGLADRAVAAGAAWAPRLAAARGLIAELSALVLPPSSRPPIVCHRDFHPENVLPAAADGRLVVLDWENAGPLDPERELGYVLFAWSCGGGRFDPAAARALVAAYASASGSAPLLGADLLATAIAVTVNFLGSMAEQALDDPAHRDYAEEALAGLLDHDLDDVLRVARLGPDRIISRRWQE